MENSKTDSKKNWNVFWYVTVGIVLLLMITGLSYNYLVNSKMASLKNNISVPQDLTKPDNIDKYIEALRLRGINIVDKQVFKDAIAEGINDGRALSDLNPKIKSSTDFATGYGAGYAIGCVEVKSKDFCKELFSKKESLLSTQ